MPLDPNRPQEAIADVVSAQHRERTAALLASETKVAKSRAAAGAQPLKLIDLKPDNTNGAD
ncbi:MAG TPA: hypothetical protein VL048_03690 [Xanthobacteraceae bacterium]|nr:hypothetical protein [Xanthobacteraceae bacterium]